jgi:hypothetical protein
VVLAAGGTYAAIKMSKSDADRIEQSTGVPPEEMTEEELVQAMEDLGIKSMELTDDDQAIIEKDSGKAQPTYSDAPAAGGGEDYIEELEKLADLRDRGIITDDDFEAKKKDLLGL